MRAILTIFPHPLERQVEKTSTSKLEPSRPKRSEAILPAVNTNTNPPPTIESLILQRLLAELEARATTRFPAPYLAEQVQPTRRTGWFRAQLALLWLLSIILCIFVVKYFDRETTAQIADPAQTRSITKLTATINDQNKQFSRMFDSIQQLTSAMASSSLRTTAMQAILKRLSGGLNQTEPQPTREKIEFSPTTPPVVKMTPPQPFREPPRMEIFPSVHHHRPIGDVVAMDNVVVHHNPAGIMDYWLVPRIVSDVRTMTKVVPIAQTTIGVLVHNVEETKDYIVTPSGDWLAASDPNDH